MGIYDVVGSAMLNYPALAALVGDAIFPVRTEQDYAYQQQKAKPYVRYEISTQPQQTLGGVAGNDALLTVTAFSQNPDDADSIADQIRSALSAVTNASTTPQVLHCIELQRDVEDDEVFGLFGQRATYSMLYAS